MKLLIVEDEPKTAADLKKELEENSFVADVAGDDETGAYMRSRAATSWSSSTSCCSARTAGRCCASCASAATKQASPACRTDGNVELSLAFAG